MHLKAIRDTAFSVGRAHFSMRAGETIHTENSHKYGPRGARLLLNAGGWMPIREWTDADGMFCLLLAEAKSKRSEEHTSELQSLMRISYAVFCLKKKITRSTTKT